MYNTLKLIINADISLSVFLYRYSIRHHWVRCGFWASRLGDGWLYALIYLYIRRCLGEIALATNVAEAVLLAWGACGVVKMVMRRKRPQRTAARMNHSFPSQHTAVAVAVASVVGGPWAWGLAVGVAVGRVLCGAHWVGDVVAGAMIGVGVGRWI